MALYLFRKEIKCRHKTGTWSVQIHKTFHWNSGSRCLGSSWEKSCIMQPILCVTLISKLCSRGRRSPSRWYLLYYWIRLFMAITLTGVDNLAQDCSNSSTLTMELLPSCAKPSICSLRWRHNERDSVSNHQPHDCLLNRLFRRRSKKTPKLRVTGLCAGNSPGTGEFPAQMASYAENVSIWWRHHVTINYVMGRT